MSTAYELHRDGDCGGPTFCPICEWEDDRTAAAVCQLCGEPVDLDGAHPVTVLTGDPCPDCGEPVDDPDAHVCWLTHTEWVRLMETTR